MVESFSDGFEEVVSLYLLKEIRDTALLRKVLEDPERSSKYDEFVRDWQDTVLMQSMTPMEWMILTQEFIEDEAHLKRTISQLTEEIGLGA